MGRATSEINSPRKCYAHLLLKLGAERRVTTSLFVSGRGILKQLSRKRVGRLREERHEVTVKPVRILLDEVLRLVRHLYRPRPKTEEAKFRPKIYLIVEIDNRLFNGLPR